VKGRVRARFACREVLSPAEKRGSGGMASGFDKGAVGFVQRGDGRALLA